MNFALLFLTQIVLLVVCLVGSRKKLINDFVYGVLGSIINAIGLAVGIHERTIAGIVWCTLLLTFSVIFAWLHRNDDDDDYKKRRKKLRQRALARVTPRGRKLVVQEGKS